MELYLTESRYTHHMSEVRVCPCFISCDLCVREGLSSPESLAVFL